MIFFSERTTIKEDKILRKKKRSWYIGGLYFSSFMKRENMSSPRRSPWGFVWSTGWCIWPRRRWRKRVCLRQAVPNISSSIPHRSARNTAMAGSSRHPEISPESRPRVSASSRTSLSRILLDRPENITT